MAKKKYITFKNLRAFWDMKTDTIRLTSEDPDLAARGWSLTLNGATKEEQMIRDLLVEAEVIPKNYKSSKTSDKSSNPLLNALEDLDSAGASAFTLDDLLNAMIEEGGVDLQLHAGYAPIFRKRGMLEEGYHKLKDFPDLSSANIAGLLAPILTSQQITTWGTYREIDVEYKKSGQYFRVNIFQQNNRIGAIIRYFAGLEIG